MNAIKATIKNITTDGILSIVDLEVGAHIFSAQVINDSSSLIKIGNTVEIIFKESEVVIAKGLSGLVSSINRFGATITAINKGKIMSEIVLDFDSKTVVSIITTRSANRLELAAFDQIEFLIKANEISIKSVDE